MDDSELEIKIIKLSSPIQRLQLRGHRECAKVSPFNQSWMISDFVYRMITFQLQQHSVTVE